MDNKLLEYFQDVLITIHENIRELKERKTFADASEMDYIEIKLYTYNEVLAIFRMTACEFNITENELGI